MTLVDTKEFSEGVYLVGHITSGDHPIQWGVYFYEHGAFHDKNSPCGCGRRIDPDDGEIDYESDLIYSLPKTHNDMGRWNRGWI
jgi:hypothetical protein